MSTGEIAYLALALSAFFVFMAGVGYATWRTEGPPAWFAGRAPTRSPDAGRAPGAAAQGR